MVENISKISINNPKAPGASSLLSYACKYKIPCNVRVIEKNIGKTREQVLPKTSSK